MKPSLNAVEPLALQLERWLVEEIRSGRLPAGERLAPTAILAKQWGVNPVHVQRALRRLAGMGYLERKQRSGTVVRALRKRRRVVVLAAANSKEERFHSLRKILSLLDAQLGTAGYEAHLFDNLDERFADERERAIPLTPFSKSMEALRPVALVELGFDLARYQSLQWGLELPRIRCDAPLDGGELSYCRDSFFRLAFEHLAKKGFRRTTLIARDHRNALFLELARRNAKAQGVEISRTILISEHGPNVALDHLGYQKLKQVLSNRAEAEKEVESMVVVDDILMRGVAKALQEAKWNQRDREIVVLGVKGIRHRYPFKVTRVEIQLDELVSSIVQLTEAKVLDRRLPRLPIEIPCRLATSARPPGGGASPRLSAASGR